VECRSGLRTAKRTMKKEKCGIFCSEELAVLLDRLEAFL
jgi:hypothetical protein